MSRGIRDGLAEADAMSPQERRRACRRFEVRRRPVALVLFARAEHIRAQALPLMLAGDYASAWEIYQHANRHLALGKRALGPEGLAKFAAATSLEESES